MIIEHPTEIAHFLLDRAIRPGDVVIDATVGYGDDTLFLAEHVADFGHVYGFEIQKKAIDSCADRLTKANQANQVTLLNQGHERIITALPPDLKVQAAIFSLGALAPNSFEHITLPNTTISAYHQILSRLNRGGLIVFVINPQFNETQEEIDYLLADLSRLDANNYQVSHFKDVNTNHGQVLAIEKI
ncbi:class I SAM-dependent methyltransferase [Latilactobacillus graminis]|uniref:rRNA methylase family protein n=2 Tax=Latilactobacillus graminis TaxID=60519 RepID=A0AA89I1I6_9LACO|nr:class I SAM-dependent methyltransferase [Latilactobacillus graminis]KRM21085.1 rRNA methylase family protein [Latilactobacillus graminis DSM 20719]QFP79213.1 16S rRNA (cytosine(1402)-N(4))-methyltransferase [Latilactobacillus graminis]